MTPTILLGTDFRKSQKRLYPRFQISWQSGNAVCSLTDGRIKNAKLTTQVIDVSPWGCNIRTPRIMGWYQDNTILQITFQIDDTTYKLLGHVRHSFKDFHFRYYGIEFCTPFANLKDLLVDPADNEITILLMVS